MDALCLPEKSPTLLQQGYLAHVADQNGLDQISRQQSIFQESENDRNFPNFCDPYDQQPVNPQCHHPFQRHEDPLVQGFPLSEDSTPTNPADAYQLGFIHSNCSSGDSVSRTKTRPGPKPRLHVSNNPEEIYNISYNEPDKWDLKTLSLRVITMWHNIPMIIKRTIVAAMFNKPIGVATFYSLFAKAGRNYRRDPKQFSLEKGSLYQILGLNYDRFEKKGIEVGKLFLKNSVPDTKSKRGSDDVSDLKGPITREEVQHFTRSRSRSRSPEKQSLPQNTTDEPKSKCKDDVTILNLSTCKKKLYQICGLCKEFSCICPKRSYGVPLWYFKESQFCPVYYPGRTYYIYGFGRFSSKAKEGCDGSCYDKLCIVASIDGHITFIENTFIAAIQFFSNACSKDISCYNKKTIITDFKALEANVPQYKPDYLMPFADVDKYFVPMKPPILSDELKNLQQNCTLDLSNDLNSLCRRPICKGIQLRPASCNSKKKPMASKSKIPSLSDAADDCHFLADKNPDPLIPPQTLQPPTMFPEPKKNKSVVYHFANKMIRYVINDAGQKVEFPRPQSQQRRNVEPNLLESAYQLMLIQQQQIQLQQQQQHLQQLQQLQIDHPVGYDQLPLYEYPIITQPQTDQPSFRESLFSFRPEFIPNCSFSMFQLPVEPECQEIMLSFHSPINSTSLGKPQTDDCSVNVIKNEDNSTESLI